jgi:hypothetical protein
MNCAGLNCAGLNMRRNEPMRRNELEPVKQCQLDWQAFFCQTYVGSVGNKSGAKNLENMLIGLS